MRCLVTGGSGFVGSWLVRKLLGQGAAVAVLLRPTSDTWRIEDVATNVDVIDGDISSIEACRARIIGFGPDIVFHVAWTGAHSQHLNDPQQVFANVGGSLELVRVAQEAGAKKFVFLGSFFEYGSYRVPVREDDPVRPTSLYGSAKYAVSLLAEALCRVARLRFCCLRLFFTYGPFDNETKMLPYLIKSLLAGEEPALTLGEQVWDWLYVEDAVDAIYRVAVADEAQGVFNLGSGRAHRLSAVVEKVRDQIDPTLVLGFGKVPYRPDQIMHVQADVSRLQSATNWVPQVPLDEGLRRTVDWYRSRKVEN